MSLPAHRVELSPAGAERERAVRCQTPGCNRTTWNHGAVCDVCLPDGHEAAALADEDHRAS